MWLKEEEKVIFGVFQDDSSRSNLFLERNDECPDDRTQTKNQNLI